MKWPVLVVVIFSPLLQSPIVPSNFRDMACAISGEARKQNITHSSVRAVQNASGPFRPDVADHLRGPGDVHAGMAGGWIWGGFGVFEGGGGSHRFDAVGLGGAGAHVSQSVGPPH